MKELSILYMQRAGGHAIANWLTNQLPTTNYVFINNIFHYDNRLLFNKPLVKNNTEYLIYTIEDMSIGQAEKTKQRLLYKHNSDKLNVLIIRDPYNLFASRYARQIGETNPITGEKQPESIKSCNWSPLKTWTGKSAIDCWRNHAQEALSHFNIDLCIFYNRWIQDKSYRQQTAKDLGLNFTDRGIDEVSTHGEGSSFDGLTYQGKASEMAVDTRWKKYKYDSYFCSLFDDRIHTLAQMLFGFNYKSELSNVAM